MANKDIQSVLQEDRVFPPSAQFRKAAALKAGELQAMYAKAERDYVGFWADLARDRDRLAASRSPCLWTTDRSAQLPLVHRRAAECVAQLPGCESARARRQDRHRVRGRARRCAQAHLCRAAWRSVPVRQRAQGHRHRPRRPRRHLHAADSRGRDRHAGLRPHRRHPFSGFRRLFLQRRQGSHRGCGRQAGDHRRRRLARRPRRGTQARGRQGACRRLPQRAKRHRLSPHGRRLPDARRPRSLVARRCVRTERRLRTRMGGCGASAVSALHLGIHRQAQGHPAFQRRIPAQRQADHALGIRPEGRRCVLVHGRRRLGDRPYLRRLWAAGGRRHGPDVRGRADLSRRRPLLEDLRNARRHHSLHGARPRSAPS